MEWASKFEMALGDFKAWVRTLKRAPSDDPCHEVWVKREDAVDAFLTTRPQLVEFRDRLIATPPAILRFRKSSWDAEQDGGAAAA